MSVSRPALNKPRLEKGYFTPYTKVYTGAEVARLSFD